jgi:hypothetical protein
MMGSRTRSLFMVALRENEFMAGETESFDSIVEESIDTAQLDILQKRKELSLAMQESSPLDTEQLDVLQHHKELSLTMPENLPIEMGRLFVIIAAALCGTNFAAVKMLDQAIPLAASAALRFSLAALVVTVVVIGREVIQQEKPTQQEVNKRATATLMGAEVGAWYCLGYLCQAYGLQTVDASKVRSLVISHNVLVSLLVLTFWSTFSPTQRVPSSMLSLSFSFLFWIPFFEAKHWVPKGSDRCLRL